MINVPLDKRSSKNLREKICFFQASAFLVRGDIEHQEPIQLFPTDLQSLTNLTRWKREGSSCEHANNKYLCLPPTYSKFELPHTESVNVVEIGIDISDVLRINDKVRLLQNYLPKNNLYLYHSTSR